MADRRTRDQLRRSNEKLRAAIRKFVDVQDHWLEDLDEDAKVPLDWLCAYRDLKELMGTEQPSEGKER